MVVVIMALPLNVKKKQNKRGAGDRDAPVSVFPPPLLTSPFKRSKESGVTRGNQGCKLGLPTPCCVPAPEVGVWGWGVEGWGEKRCKSTLPTPTAVWTPRSCPPLAPLAVYSCGVAPY